MINLSEYKEELYYYKKLPFSFSLLKDCYNISDLTLGIKENITVCARVTYKRIHGGICFINIFDGTGKIQCLVSKQNVDNYNTTKDINIGDYLVFKGNLSHSDKGTLSIFVNYFQLLAKNFVPIQKEVYSSSDKDIVYRERAKSCITQSDILETLIKRSMIIKDIRQFFYKMNYHEVETPILQSIPSGGPTINTFTTYYNSLKKEMHLRVAPECYLKRMIISGFKRIFEIGRCFRNEGLSRIHSPEFTMMECYAINTTCNDMIEITSNLISLLYKKYTKKDVNFISRPYIDIVEEYFSIKCSNENKNKIEKLCIDNEIPTNNDVRIMFFSLFEEIVSNSITDPVFVTHFPTSESIMTRPTEGNSFFCERSELYWNGIEIANMSTELCDPVKQLQNFEDEKHKDNSFLNDMFLGMPPLAGLGIGIDRLIMFLIQSSNIRDIIFFPTLK